MHAVLHHIKTISIRAKTSTPQGSPKCLQCKAAHMHTLHKKVVVYHCIPGVERLKWHFRCCCSQSVLIEQVFSHIAVWLAGCEAGQAANVVTQLLDGVVAVCQEVALQVVTQLEHNGKGSLAC